MEIGRQNLDIGEETLREVRQGISQDEGMVGPQLTIGTDFPG